MSNVLTMADTKSQYLVLTDYGHAKEIGSPESRERTTYEYESPEISALMSQYSRKDYEIYRYYHEDEHDSFARQIFKNTPEQIENHHMDTVDPADDCWALGIVLFKILHQNVSPTLADLPKIKANPLLNGLLSIKRSERIDIATALQFCENKISALAPLATPSPI